MGCASLSPVVNGCNAKCCENFSFPFSPEELQQMTDVIETDHIASKFTTPEGRELRIIRDPEVEKIKSMIIYHGPTQVDPQKPYATIGELYRIDNKIPEDEPIVKPENLNYHMQRFWDWHFIKNGEIYAHTYTCKHFDTEKRICGDYENRPNMCRSFGRGCAYEGCGFETVRKMEEEAERQKFLSSDSFTTSEELLKTIEK